MGMSGWDAGVLAILTPGSSLHYNGIKKYISESINNQHN